MVKEYRQWTTQEIDVLNNLWGRVSVEDIAAELGRSKWSVYGQARQQGLPNSIAGERGGLTWSEYELNALRMMRDRGVPVERIAESLRRGVDAVKGRLSKID